MKRFPHPLALLVGCVAAASVLTWIIPAGVYDRQEHAATGRMVVVEGTYHRVEAAPLGPFEAVLAIPKGMISAADVIFLVLLAGGAFVVIEKAGTLRRFTGWLAGRLAGRAVLVIPILSLFFGAGGALSHMQEEIVAMVPVLLILSSRLGYNAMVAAAISIGAAAVGAAFSPFDPFAVLIAQKLAELPAGSGWQLRLAFLAVAMAIWIGSTMRYARASGTGHRASEDEVSTTSEWSAIPETDDRLRGTDFAILLVIAAAFATFVTGSLRFHWDFVQIAAVFFVMGLLSGLIGRLGFSGTMAAYAEGFAAMAYAAVLIGFARAIFVVLDEGRIIDSIVHGIFTPIRGLPPALAAQAMMAAHVGVHVPVPSVSGHAVLTMPVLVPLSDLMGMSRQVSVMAYHYGAGLCELITPTNGALMAVLGAAGIGYDQWIRFVAPRFLALLALGAVGLFVAL